MKKVAFILIAFVAVFNAGFTTVKTTPNEKKVRLTIQYSFTNIVTGYDHENKTELYIDGKLAATSSVKKQTESNKISVKVTKGTHEIKVVNYAFFKGIWEEHSKANNFSQDFTYTTIKNLEEKNTTIKLFFDVDHGVQVIK